MIRRLALVASLLGSGATGAQTPTIRIDDAGPGIGPAILAHVLAEPHAVVIPGRARYVFARGSDSRRTVVVLGRDAVVEGKVQGDLIVVAGDLYMHPGGVVTGRAISIGGGIYESMLTSIGVGATEFRDFTYDITSVPSGYALRYRSLAAPGEVGVTWPGIFGFGTPTYDRSNGVSLGFGPKYVANGSRFSVAPTGTYRSQLGEFDPGGVTEAQLDRRTAVRLKWGRTTSSNDRWIWNDAINSAMFLYNGDDTRNYYRATGGDFRLSRVWESVGATLTPYIGVRYERASSVRPGLTALGGPWTIFARGDAERDDRLRPNPPIDDGALTSGILGAVLNWSTSSLSGRLRADGEASSRFAQLTVGGYTTFPTFGTQSLHAEIHVVASGGSHVPRQRFAYIGGPGSVSTIELLSEGGDQLVYVDGGYDFPLRRVSLPLIGSPLFTLREALGGARVGSFPTLHQSSGVRVTAGGPYFEWMVDPAKRTSEISFGLWFPP